MHTLFPVATVKVPGQLSRGRRPWGAAWKVKELHQKYMYILEESRFLGRHFSFMNQKKKKQEDISTHLPIESKQLVFVVVVFLGLGFWSSSGFTAFETTSDAVHHVVSG